MLDATTVDVPIEVVYGASITGRVTGVETELAMILLVLVST